MDDCGHAIHDYHHDTHDFSHSLGSFIDHHTGHDHGQTQDTGWGHLVESGLNSGSSWVEMSKACDSNIGASTSTSSSSNTGW